MTLYSATVTLILVMDPMGNVPIFLSMLKKYDPKKRLKIILREALIAFVVLFFFVFAGDYILKGLGLSDNAMRIAGGIILFLIALRMIFPEKDRSENTLQDEPFIVPMAIPLIAGPSALATVTIFATGENMHIITVMLAVIFSSIASTIILLLSDPLGRLLKDRGLLAIEKLMGMILTTLAVQMFLTGIMNFIK